MSSQAIPGYGAVPMVSLRNPVSRTRAPEKRKRSRLEIEWGGSLVQSKNQHFSYLNNGAQGLINILRIIDSTILGDRITRPEYMAGVLL